jgi:hypothetical protein
VSPGPSGHHFELRDPPNDGRESTSVVVGHEQVRHQFGAVGQRFFRNQRERVFPGFEDRFRFATGYVGQGFAKKHVPRQ